MFRQPRFIWTRFKIAFEEDKFRNELHIMHPKSIKSITERGRVEWARGIKKLIHVRNNCLFHILSLGFFFLPLLSCSAEKCVWKFARFILFHVIFYTSRVTAMRYKKGFMTLRVDWIAKSHLFFLLLLSRLPSTQAVTILSEPLWMHVMF